VTVCLYLLPSLLRRYRERYPRQEIVILNERSRQIPELVRERRIDVGIASSMAPPPGVRRIAWQELPLVLLDPPGETAGSTSQLHASLLTGSPLSTGSPAQPMPSVPFVLATTGSLRSLTEQVLARAGIEPRVVAEADSMEVVKRLVLDGFGHALVPDACVTAEDLGAGLHASALDKGSPRLSVVLWLRDVPSPPPSVQNFLSLAGEELSQRVL
jgi:DNA-binding transcriptional LysR family regulator